MVQSTDTTAAQSAALIAAHAALTGYLLVNLLVLILPPCGHRSRHSEDTTGACSGHLLVNLLVLILAPRVWGSEPILQRAKTRSNDHSGAFSPHTRRERIIRCRKQNIKEKM